MSGVALTRRAPSDESNEELCVRFQAGDRSALELLVKQNSGLVWPVAKRWARACTSLSIEDLIRWGEWGICRAAETFDPVFGCKFSTHAGYWIKAKVVRAAANDGVRMGVGQRAKLLHLATHYLRGVEELVNRGVSPDEAREAMKKRLGVKRTLAQDLDGYYHAKTLSSLDRSFREASDASLSLRTLHDVLSTEEYVSVEELIDRRSLRVRVEEIRRLLDPRELAVLDERLMSDGQTLEEVGLRFGLSRERVRQVEVELIEKLRRWLTRREGGRRVLRPLRPVLSPIVTPRPAPTSEPRRVVVSMRRKASKVKPGLCAVVAKPESVALEVVEVERTCLCGHPRAWHYGLRCAHGCDCRAFVPKTESGELRRVSI
jgi:RNA polymerase sigma factor (sigma-70 family)